ncbi:MAG: DedA family protein [Chloroflexi bacterium]|nr:MAG: DedA family protein [Chloroflexota bacterium]
MLSGSASACAAEWLMAVPTRIPATEMDIRALADALGYPAAALGILIESSGIPFPGELTLVAVAAYAGTGHLNIAIVIALGALGAIVGGDLGYLIGLKGGRPFIERLLSIFRLEVGHLAQAEMFFAHHGDKTILVGRFVLGLRTWASVFAGVAHMPFWKFQLYSVLGAVPWAITWGLVGYLLLLTQVLKAAGYGGLAIAVLAGLTLLLLRRRELRRGQRPRPPGRGGDPARR